MALFIPHRCPKCFESMTLIQPQYKGGAFKGPAKGQCLNCMDEQEYDLTVPGRGNPDKLCCCARGLWLQLILPTELIVYELAEAILKAVLLKAISPPDAVMLTVAVCVYP